MTWDEIKSKAQELQKELMEMQAQVENKKNEYKAFTKAHLGIADGEPLDVFKVAEMIRTVSTTQ